MCRRWDEQSTVHGFSHSSQPLLEASALKLLCVSPIDSSRNQGAFWAHHRSPWAEWPKCQHSLPPPTAHGSDLNWNSNPSSQLFWESCSKEGHLGTCLWLWVACVCASDQGTLGKEQGEGGPSPPAADPRSELQSVPSSSQIVAGAPSSESWCFFWLRLCSYQLRDIEPASWPLWASVSSGGNRDATSLGTYCEDWGRQCFNT